MIMKIPEIEISLLQILAEIRVQDSIGKNFPDQTLAFKDEIVQIDDWIVNHGEYDIAYESIVCLLEQYQFILTGPTAIKLLEAGLIIGYKTRRPENDRFNRAKLGDSFT